MKESTDHKLTLEPKVLLNKYKPSSCKQTFTQLNLNKTTTTNLLPPSLSKLYDIIPKASYAHSSTEINKKLTEDQENKDNKTLPLLTPNNHKNITIIPSKHENTTDCDGEGNEMCIKNLTFGQTPLMQLPPRHIKASRILCEPNRKRKLSGESESYSSCSSMTDGSEIVLENCEIPLKLRKRTPMNYNEATLAQLPFQQTLPDENPHQTRKKQSITREINERRKLGIGEDLKYVEVVLDRTSKNDSSLNLLQEMQREDGSNAKILTLPCLSQTCREKAIITRQHCGFTNIVLSVNALKLKQPLTLFSKILMYNFFSSKTLEEFTAAFKAVEQSSSNNVILLSSSGPVFCSGLDPWMLFDILDNKKKDEMEKLLQNIRNLLEAMSSSKKPIVCALQGPATGFGATLALHCDIVYASERATLQWPFIKQGLPPIAGSSYLLKNHFNRNTANSILLQGDVMTAESARLSGFVSDVFCHDSFTQQVFCRIEAMAKLPLKHLCRMKNIGRIIKKEELTKTLNKEGRAMMKLMSKSRNTTTKNLLQNYMKKNLFLFE